MSTTTFSLFERFDAAEVVWCRRLNRGLSQSPIRIVFRAVSRLGDGAIWYALMVLLPVMFGWQGLHASGVMVCVGVIGLGLYKILKHRLVRERPFIRFNELLPGIAPLDRYSFPSGHTLHAVAFTVTAVAYFPLLGVVLIPFAVLVAISRVVLGLHYPTDVIAGALIGAILAVAAIQVMG
jgi:undecaprenyl-diphosphatase